MKTRIAPSMKKQKLKVAMAHGYAQLMVGKETIKATTNAKLIPSNTQQQRPEDSENTIVYYNLDTGNWETLALDKVEKAVYVIGQSTTLIKF